MLSQSHVSVAGVPNVAMARPPLPKSSLAPVNRGVVEHPTEHLVGQILLLDVTRRVVMGIPVVGAVTKRPRPRVMRITQVRRHLTGTGLTSGGLGLKDRLGDPVRLR